MQEVLYQLYISSVKEDCEKYISTKDVSVFHKKAADLSRISEYNKAIFNKEYDIVSNNYQGYHVEGNLCTVIAKLLLKEKNTSSPESIQVDVSIPCFSKITTFSPEALPTFLYLIVSKNPLKALLNL